MKYPSSKPIPDEPALNQGISRTALFAIMLTIMVLFATLGFAFLVMPTPKGTAAAYHVPWVFYANTVLLLASSVLLHLAWKGEAKAGNGIFLPICIGIGTLFLLAQCYGWYQLTDSGLSFAGAGPKVSFLYVLSGVHALHLVGGLSFLLYVWQRFATVGQRYLEVALWFWHFLGMLWVYLLAVLTLG